jgi:hypothetical protein
MKELTNSKDFHIISEELRNEYLISEKVKATDHFLIERGCKVGDQIKREPGYSTTEEAHNLLVNYYSKVYMYLEQSFFLEKAKKYTPGLINGELKKINSFIEEASQINSMFAVESYGKYGGDDLKMVYVRLKEGFYENLEVNNYPSLSTIGLVEARVYGRYFLFKEFLENKLKEFGSSTVESLLASGKELIFINGLEEQLDIKFKGWRKSKIVTASFCQALFHKKYFKETNWAKACKDFALLRYDIDIKTQVQSAKKDIRERHVARILKALFPK